jgi:nucleoside-diphosphate-sugar epimerase
MDGHEKIFVTGATGFIGTRLIQALVERRLRIRALSRRDCVEPLPGSDRSLPGPLEHELVELVRGDVLDRVSLVRGMEGCTCVFHLAAYAKNWAANPRTYYRMNVEGMLNVFNAARQLGVNRVVWTSSIVTFGPTPPGVVGDEAMPRITPAYLTEYEESKAIAEQEALRQAAGGFPVVIVNPTRVYGPGHLTEGNALARLIDNYDRGRLPVLLNRGVNVANYVFVDDVVQGHLLAMQRGRLGERYILGGENITLKDFFRAIDRVSGKTHFQIPVLHITPLVFAWLQKKRAEWFGVYPTITPGWVRTFVVDAAYRSDKAIGELGYRPTPLEEGLRVTYEWLQRLRKHPA